VEKGKERGGGIKNKTLSGGQNTARILKSPKKAATLGELEEGGKTDGGGTQQITIYEEEGLKIRKELQVGGIINW